MAFFRGFFFGGGDCGNFFRVMLGGFFLLSIVLELHI